MKTDRRGYISYKNSIPDSFRNDPEAPPCFSYSWLQRLGRMDIIDEKMSVGDGDELNIEIFEEKKVDPRFKLTVKIKKKREEERFPISLGSTKEKKIIVTSLDSKMNKFQRSPNQTQNNQELLNSITKRDKKASNLKFFLTIKRGTLLIDFFKLFFITSVLLVFLVEKVFY